MGKDRRTPKSGKNSSPSKNDAHATTWESQQQTLRAHNKKLEEAEKTPHLDSAHIDMSKDGIGKNKHGDSLAELEAREARKADAARAQAERAAERKAEKLSMQSIQSDAAEEARRRQQQRISNALEATSARAMQQEKLSRVEQFFDTESFVKKDETSPHPSTHAHPHPSAPPSTHPASPTQNPASTAQNPTPSSGNANAQTQHTSEKKEAPTSRPSIPSVPSAHDRQGSSDTSSSRQRWTRNTSGGRSGSSTANRSASPAPPSTPPTSPTQHTRARLAKMQQIERITAAPLRVAGSVGVGAVQITRSIVYRKLQETNNDTVKGISYATRYTAQAIAISRAVLTSSPQASFGATARNPLGLNARQDKLDKMLYDKLSKNGKLLSGSDLAKQANIAVRDFERKLEKQVGADLLHASDNQLKSMASRLTAQGRKVKAEINRLQAKGARLSASERKKLLDLKKQSKEIGKNLATIKNAQRAKADLLHLRRRAGDIAKRTQIRRAPKRILKQTVTMGVERTLMSNEDTQGLAYTLRYATNPTVRKITRGVTRIGTRAVIGTGKFAGKTVLRAIGQEDLPMRISRAVQRGKNAIKKTIRKGARAVGRRIANLVPSPIKTGARKVAQVARRFASIPTGIRNRFYRIQSRLMQNKVSLALRRTSARIGNAFRAVFSFVKKALAKVALILVGAFLVIFLIVVIASSVATVPAAIIMSPDTSSTGKIDLSPYSRILRAPAAELTSQVSEIRKKYESNSDTTEVITTHSGHINNAREIISMLAVRFNQQLDISENDEIEPYLTQLYSASHSISIRETRHTCSGCKERPSLGLKFDPIEGIFETSPGKEMYCSGHVTVHIIIKALGFDDIFDVDTYVSTNEDDTWEGWTEENREWAKLIYEQDWNALYTGVSSLQGITTGSASVGTDEVKIWYALLELADGNAYGAAGAMGNLAAESALRSNNVQNSWENDHKEWNDESYTAALNAGIYPNDFTKDGAGYGLAQWTEPSRKKIFEDLVVEYNTTYDDVDMQIELLRRELTGYYADVGLDFSHVCSAMQTATSVREASDFFLAIYENPGDQSEPHKVERANLGQIYFNRYGYASQLEGDYTLAQKLVIYAATHWEEYGVPADPGYCQRWAAMVYSAVGFPIDTSASAKDSGHRYGVSDDFSIIPAGAAIYGLENTEYGHVGIYVGDGLVWHNATGEVVIDTLEEFILKYDAFAWGWEAGTDLTAM